MSKDFIRREPQPQSSPAMSVKFTGRCIIGDKAYEADEILDVSKETGEWLISVGFAIKNERK